MEAKRLQGGLPNRRANQVPSSSPITNRSHRTSMVDVAGNVQPEVRVPSAPAFGFVDTVFDRIPRKYYGVLSAAGAICGLAYGGRIHASGASIVGDALVGAFAGLLIIPLLRLGVKIVLGALALGLCGLIAYFMYQAMK